MKWFPLAVLAMLLIPAAVLMWEGKAGWGWLLLLAVLVLGEVSFRDPPGRRDT